MRLPTVDCVLGSSTTGSCLMTPACQPSRYVLNYTFLYAGRSLPRVSPPGRALEKPRRVVYQEYCARHPQAAVWSVCFPPWCTSVIYTTLEAINRGPKKRLTCRSRSLCCVNPRKYGSILSSYLERKVEKPLLLSSIAGVCFARRGTLKERRGSAVLALERI